MTKTMSRRSIVAMLLAYVIPGAGHFFLGRYRRAAAFFCIVVTLFILGLRLDAVLYTLGNSHSQLLGILAALGSMGSGVLYLFATMFGPAGDFRSFTFEYGRMFTLTAGLMNLLLVLDCYDISIGRKDE
ncbi:MAG TPA: DUF6677 family protein [Thermoanaerobaculia bacterium]|nr:DUF6677 family protein [Thermoanaerobaculia bacterium]